jgi:amino acid transporter
VTQIILSMISMTHPSFEPEPWVIFVGYQIINLAAFGFNFFEHSLPWVSRSLLIFTPAMLFAVFVSCLAGGSHKQGAHMVFLDIPNISGWPNSIAFLIGLNPSAWSFSCLDAITHLADEIPQPRKNIPKALLCTVALGFCTGLPIVLAFAFSVQDLDAALSATVPSLEIFRQIYNSKAAAIALQAFVTASAFGAVIGCHTWQSRMAWSFSRDRGFPFIAISVASQGPLTTHPFGPTCGPISGSSSWAVCTWPRNWLSTHSWRVVSYSSTFPIQPVFYVCSILDDPRWHRAPSGFLSLDTSPIYSLWPGPWPPSCFSVFLIISLPSLMR